MMAEDYLEKFEIEESEVDEAVSESELEIADSIIADILVRHWLNSDEGRRSKLAKRAMESGIISDRKEK